MWPLRWKGAVSSKLEQLEAAIEAQGGPDAFFDRLASTEDLEEIARFYGASLRTVNEWRKATQERQDAWSEALEVSSHALAAEGKRIMDHLHAKHSGLDAQNRPKERLESAWVAMESKRSDQRMKLAAARNPAAYGERPQVQINQQFNLGALHLEALKAAGSMSKAIEAGNGPRAVLSLPVPSEDMASLDNNSPAISLES